MQSRRVYHSIQEFKVRTQALEITEIAMIDEGEQHNYDVFRECFSAVLIERITKQETTDANQKKRARRTKQTSPVTNKSTSSNENLGSPEELSDFVEYTAEQTFEYLPSELKTVQNHDWAKDGEMQARYTLPLTGADIVELMPSLDPAIEESLVSYGVIAGTLASTTTTTTTKGRTKHNPQGLPELLAPVLSSFITTLATPPPAPISTKAAAQEEGCEICGRNWINLTYHHLIPRFVHDKVVKRGWHREEDLQNVAWLCGACHRFVHRFAGHEELARRYYTVELLLEEESVQRWADWVGRLRWKGR